MRALLFSGCLLALAAWPALGQVTEVPAGPLAAPAAGTVQVLDRDASGAPTLARVALVHDLPGCVEEKLSLGGTWSYLIKDGDGVMVFDVGPRFPLAWCLVPWPSWKVLTPKMNGNDVILEALDRVYPGRRVTAIVLGHWHADHTEDAPALQEAAEARWGTRPPLRIMGADRPLRWRGVLPMGAESVFYDAGFKRSDWTWGLDLRDGERLGHTGFKVLAMPGHTAGNIALVDDDRRLAIGPPPRVEPPRYPWLAEDYDLYRATALRFYASTFGYRTFCSHPAREVDEQSPGAPELHKLPEPEHL